MRRLSLIQFAALALPAFLAAPAARAAWPTNPAINTPVCTANNFQGFLAAAPDSCGGVITAWQDARGTGGDTLVYIQRVDFFGQARWTPGGFPVAPVSPGAQGPPSICPDGAGGAFVAWGEQRLATQAHDVYIQHVLASGITDPAWPVDGIALTAIPGQQWYPEVVADGAGGAIAAWSDERGNVDYRPDLYAQRISATGAILWAADGVPLVAEPGEQQVFHLGTVGMTYYHTLASDGGGGVIGVWRDLRTGRGVERAQRLAGPTGAPMWTPGGVVLAATSNDQGNACVVADAGRAIFAWEDARGGGGCCGGEPDIYAQSLSPGGAVLWAPAGVAVCTAPQVQDLPIAAADGLGGAIIGWTDARATPTPFGPGDIYAQRLDAGGTPLWTPGGVALCTAPVNQYALDIVPDAKNGAIVTWIDDRNSAGYSLYAQHVDAAGTTLWATDGQVVTSNVLDPTAGGPRAVPDGAGGAVFAWEDWRTSGTNYTDIYAQQVGISGLVGVRGPSRYCLPDVCGHAYVDFGDAPEGIPAYASGAFGHFPTCLAQTAAGTQEIACGAAPGTAPGPTGYVRHDGTSPNAVGFGLGCGPANAQGLAVDNDLDGTVNATASPPFVIPSETSACSPAVALYEYERGGGGLWFGADEIPGDADAGLATPDTMPACRLAALKFKAWSCGQGTLTVYLNVLVDWSQDGDWNDVVACGTAAGPSCVPEWAVKNQAIQLVPGCNATMSQYFTAGPNAGPSWMRVTLTSSAVSDEFPWAGSANVPGGSFQGGETEDYPVTVVAPTLAVDDAGRPGALAFAAITPNPMRETAELRFTLAQAGDVALVLFDLAGRRVRSLAAGRFEAGSHEARWDGRDDAGAVAPSGFYFARLATEGRTLSRPLIRLH